MIKPYCICDICFNSELKEKRDERISIHPVINQLKILRRVGTGCGNVGYLQTIKLDLCNECSEKVYLALIKEIPGIQDICRKHYTCYKPETDHS